MTLRKRITELMTLVLVLGMAACGSDQSTDFFDRPATNNLFRVVSNQPLNGDTNVSLTEAIVFNMSQPVDPNTVVGNVRIEETLPGSSVSQLLDHRVELRNRETSIVITPNRALTYDATYTVILTTGIIATTGEPLYLDATLRFYTGAGDGIPSGVVSQPGGPKLTALTPLQNPPYPCLAFIAEFNEDLARAPLFSYKIEQEAFLTDINLGNGFLQAEPVMVGESMRRWYLLFPGDYSGCSVPAYGAGTRVHVRVREAFDLQGELFDSNSPIGDGERFDYLTDYLY